MPMQTQDPVVERQANRWRIVGFDANATHTDAPTMSIAIQSGFDDGQETVWGETTRHHIDSDTVVARMSEATGGASIFVEIQGRLYALAQERGWIPAEAELFA